MLGRRTGVLLLVSAALAGCAPAFGDAPFACDTASACPEGYACQSTICVREGTRPAARRPRRQVWINAAEMHWLGSDGGATLLVNDGFTKGAHGIFEIAVSSDGAVGAPRELLPYSDGPPMASAVVALPDGRYGVTTLRFPDIDGDMLRLDLLAIERQVTAGVTPAVETLFTRETPFLGGTEPAYVGAVASGTMVDIAWTQPSGGGKAEVLHLERSGSLWSLKWSPSKVLPPEILALSGDCALFRDESGGLMLRLGFEAFALAEISDTGAMSELTLVNDTPLFAWKEAVFGVRYGALDAATGSYPVSLVLTDKAGNDVAEDKGFVLQEPTSPHVAVPFEGGALVAPLSRDPAFPVIEVGLVAPGKPLQIVARVARESTEPIYSARAFAAGDKVYLAWTEFHESTMDLWVAVADLVRGGVMPIEARGRRMRVWEREDGAALRATTTGGWRKP
jgi:hypothetical protein